MLSAADGPRMVGGMIIDICFTYKASLNKRRSRHVTEHYVATSIKAKVAEVPSADLPVVARYEQPVDFYAQGHDRDTYANVVAWHGGGLVEPLRVFSDGKEDGIRRDADWLVRTAGSQHRVHDDPDSMGDPFYDHKHFGHLSVIAETDVAQFTPEGEAARTAAIAAVTAKAAALVVVDGLVWRPVAEPRLVSDVTIDRESGKLVVSARIVPAWRFKDDKRLRASEAYRLDQSDLVLAMHDTVLSMHDGVASMPSITVERPDLLRYPSEQACIAEAAASCLETMSGSLKGMPLAGLMAYAHLRDAFPAYGEAMARGEATDDDAMAALLAATREHGTNTQVANAIRRHVLTRRDPGDIASFGA